MLNYENFNEANTIIGGFLEDLMNLGKSLGLKKEDQAQVEQFSKDVKTAKNNAELLTKTKGHFDIEKKSMVDKVKTITAENVETVIPDLLKTYISTNYMNIANLAQTTKNKNFAPQTFFNLPELAIYKPIFNFNAKAFKGNIPNAVNLVLTNVGKKSGLKDADIKDMFTPNAAKPATGTPPAGTAPNAEAANNPSGVDQNAKIVTPAAPAAPVNASKENDFTEKLNEAVPAGFDIEKFKQNLQAYINTLFDSIYKGIDKTLKIQATNPVTNAMTQLAVAKAKEINSKPENIQKFYNYINSLDKETMIKVRDLLANNKLIDKTQYLI